MVMDDDVFSRRQGVESDMPVGDSTGDGPIESAKMRLVKPDSCKVVWVDQAVQDLEPGEGANSA
ncbi:hypothetical protein MCOR14_010314 [Pyricularia oryzae]|nr:hypothetical protein MCOR14_010314 [Pyricularia oryzae]